MGSVIADYELYLGMNHEHLLYRIRKDWVLRFKLTNSLIGKDIRFFTNYPSKESGKFIRGNYQELPLLQPSSNTLKVDRFDNFYQIGPVDFAGAFHFVFTTDGSVINSKVINTDAITLTGGQGYFVVDNRFAAFAQPNSTKPKLYSQWDLDGVVCQTYLVKNLGYFKDWKRRLMISKESGYNMIHFSPMQELGSSGSGYSLKDQLKVNLNFTAPGEPTVGWPEIQSLITFMENEWSILSMSDIVLNHTSADSLWLLKHPECAYNLKNSPHLIPAFLVDHVVWRLTQLCERGELENQGIPSNFNTSESHLHAVRAYLSDEFKKLRLHEFYQANEKFVAAEFKQWLQIGGKAPYESSVKNLELRIAGPRAGMRMGGTVNFKLAKELFAKNTTAEEAAVKLEERLLDLNKHMEEVCLQHTWCAIDCIANSIRYRYFDHTGPCIKSVTHDTPLVSKYFIHPEDEINSSEVAEELALSDRGALIMACNGWVMNTDPLKNFADIESDVYIRRELVVWSDSIKLRYGKEPEDCPYLWDRMMTYAKHTAEIFHAVRLDNCHSTPINVAQAVLDACREVRPNVYILAELFTGNEATDNIYLNKLGVNSLVREALSAFDCHDEGRMVHRFGGLQPAGAFPHSVIKRRLIPTLPHTIFCDQTHDNESPAKKRTVFDYVPSAGLCAMSACGSGSVRGYDEMIPYMIDVVTEKRLYASWEQEVNAGDGLIATKNALNKLHKWLSCHRYTETFVDQVDKNVVAVTRFCPDTAESVVLVAHSCFYDQNCHPEHINFKKIILNGRIRRLLLEARTVNENQGNPLDDFNWNEKYLNGLKKVKVFLQEDIEVDKSSMFYVDQVDEAGGVDCLNFTNFPPGSIIAVSICLTDIQMEALAQLRGTLLNQFGHRLRCASTGQSLISPDKIATDDLLPIVPAIADRGMMKRLVADLSLIDVNWLLYRCEREENCNGIGRKPYCIPNYGELTYCGLQGVVSVLNNVADENDLGHPLCYHLRDGLWFLDYILDRISQNDISHPSVELSALADGLRTLFKPIYRLPRYLKPSAFGMITGCLFQQIMDEIATRLGIWVTMGSSTVRHLVVSSIQLYGKAPVCRLPKVIPGPTFLGKNVPFDMELCSLSAGLPHFAEGMWRSWGRDTFIAIRGCLILTERYEEAANAILQYASLLRHGMIPNLMGDGNTVAPRYNARDAVWFFLYAITSFEDEIAQKQNTSPGSMNIENSLLHRPVWRYFPTDESEGWPFESDTTLEDSTRIQPLYDVIQEALQRHADGIEFRERNAGDLLDCHMKPEGFNIKVQIQEQTGFPMGGNQFNCGTWMDKMGSSDKAGNRGIPASPRDGCAVELTGLAYAVVSWLHKAYLVDPSHKYYPHEGVKLANGSTWTWAEWAKKIHDNFESKYLIPESSSHQNKGCYKDLVDSINPDKDCQLRPNYLIAMTVAPDLFTPTNAWKALEITRKQLVGPLGMCTLSPSDPDYRGYYANNDQGNDFSTAQGFNYHNGPEWVWLTGYYMRARLIIAEKLVSIDKSNQKLVMQTVRECQEIILRMDEHIRHSPWKSLPELTNAGGEHCHGSCGSQAWSIGCAIEAVYDLLKVSALDNEFQHSMGTKQVTDSAPMIGSSGSAAINNPNSGTTQGAVIRVSLWNDQLRVLCNVS